MAKKSYLNRKERIKEGILEHQEEKTWYAELWVNTIDFVSPLGFSKLHLIVETKITTCSDVALNVCRENI